MITDPSCEVRIESCQSVCIHLARDGGRGTRGREREEAGKQIARSAARFTERACEAKMKYCFLITGYRSLAARFQPMNNKHHGRRQAGSP